MLGAIGAMIGLPLADPIVGILISVAIVILLVGTVRSIGARLMDGVEPTAVDTVESALRRTPGVRDVADVRLRWVGHRLEGSATVGVDEVTLAGAREIADEAAHEAHHSISTIARFDVAPRAARSR